MKYIVVILTTFLFSGCVPTIYNSYYKPFYDDNSTRAVAAYCHGYAGPPTGINFEIPNGIKVNVKTRKKYSEDGYAFNVEIKIPSKTNVQFLSNEIVLLLADGSKTFAPKIMTVNTALHSKSISLYKFENSCPVTSVLEQEDRSITPLNISFSATEKKNIQYMPSSIKVDLPSILIDNQVKNIPSIKMQVFPKDSYAYYLTEDLQEKRIQKYKQCLKSNSEKVCNYGLQTANNSFEYKEDDFNLSGRVIWNQLEGKNQLYIHTNMKISTKVRWKFQTDFIHIEDLEAKKNYLTQINSMATYCREKNVPLITPIDSLYGETDINLEGTIGIKMPSYLEIYLPSMIINGKVFHFKPIRLELHLFDFGIDPFNC